MTRIREVRIARGLTQAELGERIGLGQTNVSQMERAGYQPRIQTLQRIARALECELSELIPEAS